MMIKIALSMGQEYIKDRNETRDFIDNKLIYFLKKSLNCEIFLINNFNKINKSNIRNLNKFLNSNKINLIVLSGGQNIGTNKLRDSTEINLIKFALKKKISLIGFCRGMQLINIFFKGSLKKINGHVSKINKIYDLKNEKIKKKICYHGNGILKLGKGLKILHKSSDNEIESFVHKSLKILGVMWHPERVKIFDYDDIKLIKKFFSNK